MAKTLRLTYPGLGENDGKATVPVTPPIMPQIEIAECSYLKVAKKTYPSLTAEDQKWLLWEHVHFKPDFSQGHFTLRLARSGNRPSINEWMQKKKTHGLFAVTDEKKPNEEGEQILFLFLVDLRKALLHSDVAKKMHSDVPYLLYDVMSHGVWKFCERLRV